MEKIVKELIYTTTAELIEGVLQYCQTGNYGFACWRSPRSDYFNFLIDLKGCAEIGEVNLEESQPGFILAPYNRNQHKLFLQADLLFKANNKTNEVEIATTSKSPEDLFEFLKEAKHNYSKRPVKAISDTPDASTYEQLVEHCIEKIKLGNFSKVVPSRTLTVDLSDDLPIGRMLTRLGEKYENAFVSLTYTAKSGVWIGATPELLLSTKDNIFSTVALAGTQKFDKNQSLANIAWTQKEIEEQALVSRYIINCFKQIRLREFEEHGPKTVRAGNLIHLKTDFEVDMVSTNFQELGTTMLKLLHPTSAVCGMPLAASYAYLLEHERYDRSYFSGYLGPVNIEDNTSIYVNLRCMRVLEKAVQLFAGAGVTEDSIPHKEWLETQMKMATLLDVIQDL